MNRTGCSITAAGGLVLAPDFSGFLHCLDARTGRQLWVHDMEAATFGAPLVCDGKVYAADENGRVTVFALSRDKQLLAERDFDQAIYCSPVFANGVLYVTTRSTLYAIRREVRSPRRPLRRRMAPVARTGADERFARHGIINGVAAGGAAAGMEGRRIGRGGALGRRRARPCTHTRLPAGCRVLDRVGRSLGRQGMGDPHRPRRPRAANDGRLAQPKDADRRRRPNVRGNLPGRAGLPLDLRRNRTLAKELRGGFRRTGRHLGVLRLPAGRRRPTDLHPRWQGRGRRRALTSAAAPSCGSARWPA